MTEIGGAWWYGIHDVYTTVKSKSMEAALSWLTRRWQRNTACIHEDRTRVVRCRAHPARSWPAVARRALRGASRPRATARPAARPGGAHAAARAPALSGPFRLPGRVLVAGAVGADDPPLSIDPVPQRRG